MVAKIVSVHTVIELTSGHRRSGQTSIDTSLIQSQRIGRGEHSDIGKNWSVILGVTVAVGRDINHKRNVELWTARNNRLGILCHLAVQQLRSVKVGKIDSVEVTSAQAAATTDTLLSVNLHFAAILVKNKSIVCTLRQAQLTTAATLLADAGLATAMLLGLTRARAATHTDILNRATEACHLVALEVAQADKYICVHNGATNLCSLHILSALDGYIYIVRTLQIIANNNGTANGHRSKTILPRAVEVLDGVLATTWIHCVAVSKEGLAPQLLNHIYQCARIVGAQVADVTQLAEVELDGYELAVHINIAQTRLEDKFLELGGHTVTASLGAEVCEIYF